MHEIIAFSIRNDIYQFRKTTMVGEWVWVNVVSTVDINQTDNIVVEFKKKKINVFHNILIHSCLDICHLFHISRVKIDLLESVSACFTYGDRYRVW